jgi:hypothetical protein
MPNLGPAAPEGKPQPAARAQIFRSWVGRVPSGLPIRLADLSPDIRDLVGRGTDAGALRLLRDDDGSAVVARAGRP